MSRSIWFLAVLALLPASLSLAQEKKESFTQRVVFSESKAASLHPKHFLFSPETVFDEKSGQVRLARSVLLANESGSTDHHQREALAGDTLAKVQFAIDVPPGTDGELLVFGSAKQISVNGQKLEPSTRLISTGWSRVSVPAKLLKSGTNEVVLGGGGSLLVEPGRTGKSFKSRDGGKTWSQENLTGAGDVAGEYLVRFRLPQHARTGTATTHPIDLHRDAGLASPRLIEEIRLIGLRAKQPPDTTIKASFRLGSTPTPSEKTWTTWMPMAEVNKIEQGNMRWAQVKFELETTDQNESPRLPAGVGLSWSGVKSTQAVTKQIAIAAEPTQEDLVVGALPFVYQKPHARLEHLRKRYKLDDVIAPGKTEMEQFMLLRYWIRNQWHTGWGSHPAQWIPPWDSLIILDCKDQPECMTMCTHYGCVFTQCCQALGWNARHCILDHHCVSEVYSFEHDRWIMMDTGNSAQRADVGLHFERKGVPLSARELHLAYMDKNLDGITVRFTPWALSKQIQHMCRPAPKGMTDHARPDEVSLAELKKFPVCQIENYRRYAFPARNTFLTSLLPGELYHGYSEYFHDGYCWVGDGMDRPTVSPEYSRLVDPHREDADWKLGGTRVHLSRSAKADVVDVELESLMPNHARFEVFGDKGWQPTPAKSSMSLEKGQRLIRVRSVNHWGKAGRESRVTLTTK